MSNYLRRLAEQSLGVQPSVKPRLPGRYETADAFGIDMAESEPANIVSEAAGSTPDSPVQQHQPPALETTFPRLKQFIRELSEDTAGTSSEALEAPASKRRPQRQDRPVTPLPAEPGADQQEHFQEIADRSDQSKAEQFSSPQEPGPGPKESGGQRPTIRPAVRPVQAADSDSRAAQPQASPSPPARSSADDPESDETRTVPRPNLQPAPTTQPRLIPATAESEAVAPTVQVTIGRIEIRATPPPEKAKRRPPAQPVMSLEEYMRRRREGGRR